jgi:hypothetical protein
MKKSIALIVACLISAGCAGLSTSSEDMAKVMVKVKPGGSDELVFKEANPKVFLDTSGDTADKSLRQVVEKEVFERLSGKGALFVDDKSQADYTLKVGTGRTYVHRNTTSEFLVTDGFYWGARMATGAIPIAREIVSLTSGTISAVRWTKDMIDNHREVSVSASLQFFDKDSPLSMWGRGANVVMSAKGLGREVAYVVAGQEFGEYIMQGVIFEKEKKLASVKK